MAWNTRRWVVGVGLLLGGLGTGCGTSDARGEGAPEVVAPEPAVDEGPAGGGAVTEEPADPVIPPEQPVENEPPPPPPDPGPSACERLPQPSPAVLATWRYWERTTPTDGTCQGAAADGRGDIIMLTDNAISTRMYFAVLPSVTTYDWEGSIDEAYRMDLNGQPQGFLGHARDVWDFTWVTFLDISQRRIIQHPRPPSVSLHSAVNPAGGMHEVLADGTLHAYGATGELRWSLSVASLLNGPVSALGVNTEGHALLLSAGAPAEGAVSVEGVWVDSSGQPGTPFLALTLEQAPDVESRYTFAPLLQGGLVLGVENTFGKKWVAAFEGLQAASSPLPSWLDGGDGRRFELLPGGKGYLRWSQVTAGNQGCQHEARLIAASGESCGKVVLPAMDAQEGCGKISMGGDGTVVNVLSSRWMDVEKPFTYCRVRWWPALFRE
ncbi:hypothetical protein D7X55_08865 [Corallococcus sp. AB049A]|uniref:Lipoprotein n=1 Tax=Corallococcus interemptor TaxID=2316720 RepID=A0A3A8QX42_9BACT|nr:hypothetical protein D7X96_09475 [Corallococcus interemptor]RKI71596.1 hypothetical protein D7X55_08865 [Corallococcus sp. AB049A]